MLVDITYITLVLIKNGVIKWKLYLKILTDDSCESEGRIYARKRGTEKSVYSQEFFSLCVHMQVPY